MTTRRSFLAALLKGALAFVASRFWRAVPASAAPVVVEEVRPEGEYGGPWELWYVGIKGSAFGSPSLCDTYDTREEAIAARKEIRRSRPDMRLALRAVPRYG